MTDSIKFKIDDLKTPVVDAKGIQITIGKIPGADDDWEPMGPTPAPGIKDLRSWDRLLLKKFPPMYWPNCDMCCLCTYGKKM